MSSTMNNSKKNKKPDGPRLVWEVALGYGANSQVECYRFIASNANAAATLGMKHARIDGHRKSTMRVIKVTLLCRLNN